MRRTQQSYAIEFAEYLARAAERYQRAMNGDDLMDRAEAYAGLSSAIYEFRKRASRV